MKPALFLLAFLPLLSLTGAEPKPVPSTTKLVANATNRFTITGMHCDGCAKGIASELKRTPGVASANVSFTNKLAVVAFDTNRATTKLLRQVIAEAGYEAQPVKPAKQ